MDDEKERYKVMHAREYFELIGAKEPPYTHKYYLVDMQSPSAAVDNGDTYAQLLELLKRADDLNRVPLP